MRKKYIFGKKLYISILTTIVVLLTTVATTFAWVGVFANSTFDTFNINIKASSLEEYGIVISPTGEDGTFSDSIDGMDIKKQILKNWGYNIDIYDNSEIEYIFANLNMHQCTNLPIIENNQIKHLGVFKTIENNLTNHYFKFDIYVAAIRYYESSSTSDYMLDAFLENGLIQGIEKTFQLDGEIKYPTSFINPLTNLPSHISPVDSSSSITQTKVNSASACRVAFEKYEVVDRYDTSAYNGKNPISTVIYTGDTYNYPTYNQNNNVYEFGGILPNDSNFAVMYYNAYDFRYSRNGIRSVSVPQNILNTRGVGSSTADKILSLSTNHLIDSTKTTEQISLDKMMKITISFWIEGWDSDCFNVLNKTPITLSIALSTVIE